MNWKFKALVQKTLENVPAGRALYTQAQRHFGGLRHLNVAGKVAQGNRLLEAFRKANQTVTDMEAVEIGTGWVPIVPMLFWLHGLRSCVTYDIEDLLCRHLIHDSASQLIDHFEHGATGDSGLQPPGLRERLSALRAKLDSRVDCNELLRLFRIFPHAPTDAGATGHKDNSVDLVFSNTVLQHVPVEEIRRIYSEAFRILKPGAWMLHHIDPSDMFSHADTSLSGVDFLQYSEQEFAKYNTRFCYQNRLRAPQHQRLCLEAGFEIAVWECAVNQRALTRLPQLRLHRDYAGFTPEEICSFGIRVVARKPCSLN
jgi:hypothetical protein